MVVINFFELMLQLYIFACLFCFDGKVMKFFIKNGKLFFARIFEIGKLANAIIHLITKSSIREFSAAHTQNCKILWQANPA